LHSAFCIHGPRPWLVGFSGGIDSTMVASLIVQIVAAIPDEQRKKALRRGIGLVGTRDWPKLNP